MGKTTMLVFDDMKAEQPVIRAWWLSRQDSQPVFAEREAEPVFGEFRRENFVVVGAFSLRSRPGRSRFCGVRGIVELNGFHDFIVCCGLAIAAPDFVAAGSRKSEPISNQTVEETKRRWFLPGSRGSRKGDSGGGMKFKGDRRENTAKRDDHFDQIFAVQIVIGSFGCSRFRNNLNGPHRALCSVKVYLVCLSGSDRCSVGRTDAGMYYPLTSFRVTLGDRVIFGLPRRGNQLPGRNSDPGFFIALTR